MDNMSNALIMAGSVLLFIVGITTAVYNYTKLMEVNDRILINSEYYNRDVEGTTSAQDYSIADGLNDKDTYERFYTGAEIANMIFNMYTVKTVDAETGEEIHYITVDDDGNPTQGDEKVVKTISSDIAFKQITVNGVTFTRDSNKTNEYSSQFKTIANIVTLKENAMPKKYKMSSSSVLNGSESVVTFIEVDE